MTNDRRSSADWLAGEGYLAGGAARLHRQGRGDGPGLRLAMAKLAEERSVVADRPAEPVRPSDQPRRRDQTAAEWRRQRHLVS